MANATSTQLQELYVAYFGRAADPTGIDYWKEKGITTAAFAADMYAAPEFKSVYGSLTTEAQVNQIYKNLFDRAADVTGLTYWTKEINLGNLQLAEIAVHLIWAAQNNAGSSDDKTALTNRTEAAAAYTAEVRLTTEGILAYTPLNDGKGSADFSAGDNIAAAKAYLAGIDKDTAYTAAGITTSVNSIKTNGVPADTSTTNIALTTSTDFKTLTSSNDTINASGATLGSDDVITDLGGTDTLKISVSPSAAASTILNSTGVENIQVTNTTATSGASQTYTFTSATGVTSVSSYLSSLTGDVVFSDLQSNATVILDGSKGDVTADFANPVVVGSSDVANVEIKNDASTAILNIGDGDDEFETINIAVGTGKNSITEIEDGASDDLGETSKIVITGSGQLTLGETVLKDASEIDGSAATGKLLITTDATVDTLKGGSGDDTFTLTIADFGNTQPAKTIDGGGGTDTVVFAADVAASDLDAKDSGKHSISAETVKYADQTLAAAGAASLTPSLDLGSITGANKATGVLTNSDTDGNHKITFEVTGLPSAGTVDVSSTQDSAVAGQGLNVVKMSLENASGTADALTFDGDGTLSALTMVNTADDTATVGVTETGDVETLTISSSDVVTSTGAAKTLTIATLTGDDLTTVNIVGSNAITISALDLVQASGSNSASTAEADRAKEVITFDASTSTGAVSIVNSETNVLKITGGSGVLDVDLRGTATTSSTTLADVITGGSATTDRVTIADSASAATFYPSTTGVEIIEVETITSGAKTTSLKNTTGVTTVEITDPAGAGFGTTISDIDGQAIKFMTNAGGSTDFSANAMVLNAATGVTNTTVEISNSLTSKLNDAVSLDGTVFSTNSGAFTINDTAVDNAATGDHYLDHVYEVAGTAATAKLTSLTITGGGDTDTTTAKMDASTHTITAGTNVDISTIDATGATANLDLVSAAIKTGGTVKLGSTDNTLTVDGLDLVADEIKITDAGGTDILAATSLGVTNETAIRPNTNGIETFDFDIVDDTTATAAAVTFDMRDAVGLTSFELAVLTDGGGEAGTTDEAVTISNMANGASIALTGADTHGTIFGSGSGDVTTIDAAISGASSVTVTNKGNHSSGLTVYDLTFGTTYTTVTIDQEAEANAVFTTAQGTKVTTLNIGGAKSLTNGTALTDADMDLKTTTFAALTTLNIDSNAGDISFGTTALSAAKLTTLNIVGDKTVAFGGSSGSTTTLLDDVNASTATGAITFGTSADFATTSDIALGTGNDTLNLVSTVNTSTTLDMGEKASDNDTLNLTGAMNLGITNIDLSQADQITQMNGVVDTAVQTGIESIDLSGLTGTYGTVVTGSTDANTITGSPKADIINAGGGIDVINAKAGEDNITITDASTDLTAASKVDTVQIASGEGFDTITGFVSASDVLDLSFTAKNDDDGTAVNKTGFGATNAVVAANFITLDDWNLNVKNATFAHDLSVVIEIDSGLGTATLTESGFRTGMSSFRTTDANQGNFIFIAYSGTGTDADAGIFEVDFAGETVANSSKTLAAGDTVTQLAIIKGVGADNLVAADFL